MFQHRIRIHDDIIYEMHTSSNYNFTAKYTNIFFKEKYTGFKIKLLNSFNFFLDWNFPVFKEKIT